MPDFVSPNGKIHFTEREGNLPVFLLHAGAGSSRQWTKVISYLNDSHRALAPDFWGFGATDRWGGPNELSHDDQALIVLALADHLAIDRFHVVGHSYGGASAVRLALHAPDRLKSMVLIEPVIMTLLRGTDDAALFQEYSNVATGFIEAAARGSPEEGWRRFIDYRNGSGTWDRLTEEAKGRFVAATQTTVEGYKSNLQNPTTREELSRIVVPTLVLCGSSTTKPDSRVSEIVRDNIPNAAYAILEGAEHMSPLSHPEQVSAHIDAHVRHAEA